MALPLATPVVRALLMHGALLLAVLCCGWAYAGTKRREARARAEDAAAAGPGGERETAEAGAGVFEHVSAPRDTTRGPGTSMDGGAADAGEYVLVGGADAAPAAAAAGHHDHQKHGRGVRLSVIIPMKGVREHTLRNLRSHMATEYAGGIEIIVVVQGPDDPAYDAILKERRAGVHARPGLEVRLIVAGLATGTSQKVHNMLAGLSASSASDYVLFLDDDVQTHPGTVQDQIDAVRCAAARPHADRIRPPA